MIVFAPEQLSLQFLGEFLSDQCFHVTFFDLIKTSILLNQRLSTQPLYRTFPYCCNRIRYELNRVSVNVLHLEVRVT